MEHYNQTVISALNFICDSGGGEQGARCEEGGGNQEGGGPGDYKSDMEEEEEVSEPLVVDVVVVGVLMM